MKSLALSQIRQREIPKIVGHLVLVTVLKNSKKIESVIQRLKKVDKMKGDNKAMIKGYNFLLDRKNVCEFDQGHGHTCCGNTRI